MKLTKIFGISLASFAMYSDLVLAKWPDQSLYGPRQIVAETQNLAATNTTGECHDQTLSMIGSVLSYKVDVDTMETYLLEGMSLLKTLLNGKKQFNALDLMDIAATQIHWFPPAGLDLSDISFANQFAQVKTIYYSSPILRHTHDWVVYVAKASAQSAQWNKLSQCAVEVFKDLESTTPAVHNLFHEIVRVLTAPEVLKLLGNLKNQLTKATPNCVKLQDTRISKKSAAINAVVDARAKAASNVPSCIVDLTAPKPGNVPVLFQQRTVIFNVKHPNHSNYSAPVIIKDDESSAITSYRVPPWSIMGAVIVIISGVTLF
ncbi:LAME_0G14334g1_1 [Lachancea meyersii CBS 8951]|uniref:LAME_0G14334g1_1 n=1 Tax=Lachancea meyersii CBS 8951 TaxID=1266667 RepID=A0A1G4KAB1_9SACH|nr:LAME_0G14334g1_1 [Lachancea meyersii CBS 8951]